MIVLKFGGTSAQDAEALDGVGDIVAMRRGEKDWPVAARRAYIIPLP